tara:strand:- start:5451 stop:8747 length:3297 start_codon:yes stop_codon:yes gene_type:complete
MAISDFDFKSPGVQIREVDKSTFPQAPDEPGIVIIGRAPSGPGMTPVKVNSLEQFELIFGKPINGLSSGKGDVYRNGNTQGPTYGMYAAKAWLASGESPVTFIRLLGEDNAESTAAATKAGWNLGGAALHTSAPESNTSAYGLFVMPSSSATADGKGTLAAIIYTTGSALTLSGTAVEGSPVSEAGTLIKSVGSNNSFILDIWDDASTLNESLTFHFNPDNRDGYIRNVLNTNPQRIYTTNYASSEAKTYFLGETFEESYNRFASATTADNYAMLLPLELKSGGASDNFINHLGDAAAPKTGWIISKDPSPQAASYASWKAEDMKKLFRIHSRHDGEWMHKYHIRVTDLAIGNTINPDSSFTIEVVRGETVVERFSNLNLNAESSNFVARRIGDAKLNWDTVNRVFNTEGEFPNRSNYIRIEQSDALKANALSDDYAIPWGFYGPARPKGFTLVQGSSGPNAFGDTVNDGASAAAAKVTLTFAGQAHANNNDEFKLTVDGIEYKILANNGGSTATDWSADGANFTATIDGSPGNAEGYRDEVFVLVNKIDTDNWVAAKPTSTSLTLTAKSTGPGFTVTYSETTDDNNALSASAVVGVDDDDVTNVYIKGNDAVPKTGGSTNIFAQLANDMSASFRFPRMKLTEQSTANGADYTKNDDMGVRQAFSTDKKKNAAGVKYRGDYGDLCREQVFGLHSDAGTNTEHSFIFSMDDVKSDPTKSDGTNTARWYWASGSHAAGTAYTYLSGSNKLLTNGPRSFNIPIFGGRDGLDITHVDPFSNLNVLATANISETSHYAYNSIAKAFDMLRDEEQLPASLIAMPGLTNNALLTELVEIVETRKDTMAIVDYADGYKEKYENNGAFDTSGGTVATVKDTSDTLEIDSSRVATYFPRVRITDGAFNFIAPASVAAIGALAFNDANSSGPWFAPAGFNRGGLSILGGRDSGLSVVNTLKNLTKANRDDLYDSRYHINPIARFPAVGEIVIFGQKTLYKAEPTSALTRVNVRRLLIYLREKIGAIADTVLFEQSVAATFNNFSARVRSVLDDVKSNFGITQYKIDLDESLTAEAQDKNMMYVKIFIKPARAIEFIAIDFIISRSDAEL